MDRFILGILYMSFICSTVIVVWAVPDFYIASLLCAFSKVYIKKMFFGYPAILLMCFSHKKIVLYYGRSTGKLTIPESLFGYMTILSFFLALWNLAETLLLWGLGDEYLGGISFFSLHIMIISGFVKYIHMSRET